MASAAITQPHTCTHTVCTVHMVADKQSPTPHQTPLRQTESLTLTDQHNKPLPSRSLSSPQGTATHPIGPESIPPCPAGKVDTKLTCFQCHFPCACLPSTVVSVFFFPSPPGHSCPFLVSSTGLIPRPPRLPSSRGIHV